MQTTPNLYTDIDYESFPIADLDLDRHWIQLPNSVLAARRQAKLARSPEPRGQARACSVYLRSRSMGSRPHRKAATKSFSRTKNGSRKNGAIHAHPSAGRSGTQTLLPRISPFHRSIASILH